MTYEYTGKERRHTVQSVAEDLIQCKTEVGQQVEKLNKKLEDHQESFETLKGEWGTFINDFSDMLSIFRSARGFFVVLGWIGTAAKWISVIAASFSALWYGLKHWPK